MTKNAKRIEQAKELLTMIEAVSHDDNGQLSEINARFACLYANKEYYRHNGDGSDCRTIAFYKVSDPVNDFNCLGTVEDYSRSRDALKATRPEGWIYTTTYSDLGERETALSNLNYNQSFIQAHNDINHEILAEFHAIVQAWIYVWENEA